MGRAKLNTKGLLRWLSGVVSWVVVILVVGFVVGEGREHRKALKVEQLVINIADSTSNGNLITTPMIKRILASEKIKTEGELVDEVPLSRIERAISKNGFVKSVRAYTNYQGELHIDIYQRSAAARILLNGYNCYISSEGYLFSAPPTTALYTPVITGAFKPLFPANYVGNIREYTTEKIDELELEIEKIEREKYPILQREKENNEDKRAVRRRFINRSAWESKDDFARRVAALREENRKKRELYAYRQRIIDKELLAISKRQEAVRERQKKLQKSCDDFHNLITFVEMVERDNFWRSEVVQIMLSRGVDDQINISLAVRSGDFKIHFGTLLTRQDYYQRPDDELTTSAKLRAMIPSATTSKRIRVQSAHKEQRRQEQLLTESIEKRFKRLEEFYREALPRVGWNRYREINIEFENQVVCKK